MNQPTYLKGSIPALVTPMHENGNIDFESFKRLIDWHIHEKSDGLVIVGTSGESPTVSYDEHCQLIQIAVEHTREQIPIIAGTGANSTDEAIHLAKYALKAGAQAQLSVVPYYNKPTQEGLFQHFSKIANEISQLPLILYDVPGRTITTLNHETIIKLAENCPSIIGIKDASGDMLKLSRLRKALPDPFVIFSGDDPSGLAAILLGANGCISVTANVAPRKMHDMIVAASTENVSEAISLNNELIALHQLLFSEANPIPVKWACYQMKLIGKGIRLPLTCLSESNQKPLLKALIQAGIQI